VQQKVAMENKVFRFSIFGLYLLALGHSSLHAQEIATNATASDKLAPHAVTLIAPDDPRLRYEGRFDFSDSNAPVVIWQASRISIDFEGDTVGFLFGDAKGQCFFNASVDNTNNILELREGMPAKPPTLSGFGSGRHHLLLFKRSEANAGTVAFHGITLEPGAKAWASAPAKYKLGMAFFGDSISVGACNEDGEKDQWEDRRTHNAALSYTAMTAAVFGADHRNISVSGMGVVTGWVTMRASEIWDRVYPDPKSARADLTKWTPQVVFVEYGDNDESYPKAHSQPFPTNFTAGYVALVHSMRQAYPSADFVLVRGAMVGGWKSKPLGRAWDAVITELESEDKGIHHVVFRHHSTNHPRVADDRAVADDLIAWLKRQAFMRPYL
jgi:hypothetical protein